MRKVCPSCAGYMSDQDSHCPTCNFAPAQTKAESNQATDGAAINTKSVPAQWDTDAIAYAVTTIGREFYTARDALKGAENTIREKNAEIERLQGTIMRRDQTVSAQVETINRQSAVILRHEASEVLRCEAAEVPPVFQRRIDDLDKERTRLSNLVFFKDDRIRELEQDSRILRAKLAKIEEIMR